MKANVYLLSQKSVAKGMIITLQDKSAEGNQAASFVSFSDYMKRLKKA